MCDCVQCSCKALIHLGNDRIPKKSVEYDNSRLCLLAMSG